MLGLFDTVEDRARLGLVRGAKVEHAVVDGALGPVAGNLELVVENVDVGPLGTGNDLEQGFGRADVAVVDVLDPVVKTIRVGKTTEEVDIDLGDENAGVVAIGDTVVVAVAQEVRVDRFGFSRSGELVRYLSEAQTRIAVIIVREELFQTCRPERETTGIGSAIVIGNVERRDLLFRGQCADIVSHGRFFPLCSTLSGQLDLFTACQFFHALYRAYDPQTDSRSGLQTVQ